MYFYAAGSGCGKGNLWYAGMKKDRKYWIIIVSLLAVSVVIILCSFAVFFHNNAERVERTNLYYLEQDSGRLAEQIDVNFRDCQNYLKNISSIFADSSIENLDEMQMLLERMATESPFDNLYFTYPDGTSYRFSGENKNVAEREYFQKALQGEAGITEPFISKMTGRRIIICYQPVEKNGDICAVLLGVLFTDTIEEKLKTIFMNEKVYSAIISEDGNILIGSNDTLNGKNLLEEIQSWEVLGENSIEGMKRNMCERRSGLLTYKGLEDTSMVIYRPLGKNEWYLIQNLPSAVLRNMKGAINTAAVYLAIALSFGFLALFLAFFLWLRKRHGELYVENQRVHAILESSYSLIVEFDELDKKAKWYGDAEKLFMTEKKHMELKQIMPPEDWALFEQQMQDVRNGKEYATELRLKCLNGEFLWCNCHLRTIRSLDGKIISILGVIRNIDEHKKKEIFLMNEKDLLAESIHMLGDTYFKILMVNRNTGKCRLIKTDEPQMPEKEQELYQYIKEVEQLIYPDYLERVLESFNMDMLKKELSPENPRKSFVYLRKQNAVSDYKWAQIDCLLCENGRDVMIYIKNVNEERIKEEKHRQELEKALLEAKEASRVKTSFLEYISHDLRTPMNAVIGMNRLSIKALEEEDVKSARHYAERAASSADYLMELISGILELAHFQRKEMVLKEMPFSWENVVESCREFFDYITKERAVSLEIESSIAGEYIGDFMRIRQVLYNLIENAVKFNKPDGKVMLRITSVPQEKETEQIQIVLSDTGIGIDRHQMDKLFEPFSRGTLITSKVESGTGIGLALTKYLVDAMNGEIHIESELHEGTTVKLLLPMRKVKHSNPKLPVKHKKVEEMTVLVVDDIDINLEIAATLIEGEGCTVMTACSGQKALELFKDSPEGTIDVIVTDISMPEMDGYELAAEIRGLERKDAEKVYIIALSAYNYEESREQIEQCGMNAFLNKPFDLTQFREIVKNIYWV